jgi:ABC-type bacteriocin/lantibiotic exporter with double-glycine peptidase domain
MASERTDIWVIVIYSIAIGLLSLVVPIATQSLVNTIAFGTLLQPLLVLSLLVLLGLAFAGTLKALRSHVVEVMQRRVFVRVSQESIERLLRVRIEAYDDGHGPELVNRFFDVVTVQKGGATLLVEGLEVLMTTLIGMILLGVYHPILLIFALIMLVGVLVVLFPLGIGAVKTAVNESKSKYALAAWLEEIARHPSTFKSGNGTKYALERSNLLVGAYLKYRKSHWSILFRQIIGSLAMQAVGTAAVLAAGGYLVMERQLTLGQLVAAELVVAATLSSFSKFGKQLETYYDLLAAVDKLGYLTDLPLEHNGPENVPAIGCACVELRQVGFQYASGRTMLSEVNLRIEPSSRVGFTGPSGSGKSTLVDLIYGFREPTSGAMLLDGADYRSLKLYDVRNQLAIVRSPEIFHGSIEENIRLGNPNLGSAEIRRIMDFAGLSPAVEALPEGLKTELVTGGQPLTAHQTMLLMVARAIACQPRLLILDEILDRMEETPERDELITRLIDRANPWTLIIVSSSPSILRRCDRVFTVDQGTITEKERI